MRIYTRRGDAGETDLFGGARRQKFELRIEAYGEVDELNAVFGWCAVAGDAELLARLRREQGHLLTLGSWLATAPDAGDNARKMLPEWPIDASDVLEQEIDAWDDGMEALKTFILPGGNEIAARLHLARTVCRRAERVVAELGNLEHVEPAQLAYLNRLSDWLFSTGLVSRVPHWSGWRGRASAFPARRWSIWALAPATSRDGWPKPVARRPGSIIPRACWRSVGG
jgi:cob(I)alamin adenosyltransferase